MSKLRKPIDYRLQSSLGLRLLVLAAQQWQAGDTSLINNHNIYVNATRTDNKALENRSYLENKSQNKKMKRARHCTSYLTKCKILCRPQNN